LLVFGVLALCCNPEIQEGGAEEKEIQYCMVCRVLSGDFPLTRHARPYILKCTPANELVDVNVLGEAATVVAGNFQQISRRICKKLPLIPVDQQQMLQKSVFKYEDSHMFHILRDQAIVYLCMTPQPKDSRPQMLPFQLLNDVRNHAVRKYRDSMQIIQPDKMQVQSFIEHQSCVHALIAAPRRYENLSTYVKSRMEHFNGGESCVVARDEHGWCDILQAVERTRWPKRT